VQIILGAVLDSYMIGTARRGFCGFEGFECANSSSPHMEFAPKFFTGFAGLQVVGSARVDRAPSVRIQGCHTANSHFCSASYHGYVRIILGAVLAGSVSR
jgi:hypothetical protein